LDAGISVRSISGSATSATPRTRGRPLGTTTASRRRRTSSSAARAGITLDGEIHELRPWDVVRISPSVVRALEAGEDGLEIVAVGSDRPEGGDGVEVPVEWPD
jgi:hypothetical protein